MLKKEHEILQEFIGSPWKKFTFKDTKKMSGKKSDSYIYAILKKFVAQGILTEEKAGNVVLYSLNLASLKTQAYSGFTAEYLAWKKKHIPFPDLERIASKIPTPFYSFIITGSYARGIQKNDSDLDLVIICDDCLEPKKIYAELKHDCEMNIPQIHLYIFKKTEFLTMLLDKKANYGKEVIKQNLILFGGEIYYNLLGEAIQNGFNG